MPPSYPLGHGSEHSSLTMEENHNNTHNSPRLPETKLVPVRQLSHHHTMAMQAAFAPPVRNTKFTSSNQQSSTKLVEPVARRRNSGSPTKSFDSLQSLPSWVAAHHPPPHPDAMVEELVRDNALLRHEVMEKNQRLEGMQQRIRQLEAEVNELRQLPVGKISQIPVA